jgi:cytochrome P450
MNDPEFIDQIYTRAPGSRREKYKTILRIFRAPGSIIATKDHDLHRRRRAVLNPYFSMQNVRRLEPVIEQTLLNLFSRMDAWARVGTPVPMHIAYKATTKDIIHSYAFGEGEKCLEMEDLNAGFFHSLEPVWTNNIGTYFPLFIEIIASLPPLVVIKVFPRVAYFFRFMIVSPNSRLPT